MKKLLICIVVLAVLATGCNILRQPQGPENQPQQPNQQQQPNNPQQPPPDQQQPPNPQQTPNQGTTLVQDLSTDITNTAREISSVRNAGTIVIGNLAMVGLEVRDGMDTNNVEENVADSIEQRFSDGIETALVTSDGEVTDSILKTAEQIAQGTDTADLMDDIFEIWKRIQE